MFLAGSWWRLLPQKGVTVFVVEAAGGAEDRVDHPPDPTAATGEKLHDPDAHLAGHEAIDTGPACKVTEQQHVRAVDPRVTDVRRRSKRAAVRVFHDVQREQDVVDDHPEPEAT